LEEPAQPILDYASPAAQGKMRLPSNSVLDIQVLPDGITLSAVDKVLIKT
jgi:hypothetical protein